MGHLETNGTAASAEPAINLLVEELTARLYAGEAIDWPAVARAHPEHAAELSALRPALEALGRLSGAGDAAVSGVAAQADGLVTGVLGDFRVIREVGRGGMGVVYEAEQVSLGRRVALKVLPFAATLDPKQLQRFKNEARAAASLYQEHIVHVYGVGCERGVHFYAMQFIDGLTLAQVIAGMHAAREDEAAGPDQTAAYARPPASSGAGQAGPASGPGLGEAGPCVPLGHARPGSQAPATVEAAALSTQFSGPKTRNFYRTAARLVAEAADALEHAHSVGIVHRDVKPGNLIVDETGKLWVTDFGLARVGPDAGLTMSGDLVGTLRYMAPEQALARHGLADHRVDVYGLGCTLYELLTGQPAVHGNDKAEVLRTIAFEEPVVPRKLDKAIPAELETVTLKCLAKNPAERYATAGELADDLRRWLSDQAIKAKPPSLRQKAAKWVRRHQPLVRAAAAIGLVAVAAVAALAGLAWHKNGQLKAAYAEAERGRRLAQRALDEMSSQVIDGWLAKQDKLTEEHKTFLKKALQYYTELASEAGNDEAMRTALMAAHARVGHIHLMLGQTAEAERAYYQALALLQQLVADSPTPAYRHELAKCHVDLGKAQWEMHRLAEARRSMAQARAIWQGLADEFPAMPEYRSRLAAIHHNLGTIWAEQNHLADAERALRQALALMEGLPASLTAGSEYWISLAATHTALGNVLNDLGRQAEAEKFYRLAAAVLEKRFADFRNLAEYRVALAGCLYSIGVFVETPARPQDAEKTLRQSIALQKALVADFPAVPGYRYRLAESYGCLWNVLKMMKRWADLDQVNRQALALLEKLVEEDPQNSRYQSKLEEGQRVLATNLLNCPDPALRDPAKAVELAKQAVERGPKKTLVATVSGRGLLPRRELD
jgi:serine/threonine protein kinase